MSQITCKNQGFTLAEVLITLGIIGVVAVLVMPRFLDDMSERTNSHREANIAQKITKSIEVMSISGDYENFTTTEEFVNRLKKYLKIVRVCHSDNLAPCWPAKVVTGADGSKYQIKDIKTSAQLHVNNDTNIVGFVLADGANVIMTYNPLISAPSNGSSFKPYKKKLPIGNNKFEEFAYSSNAADAIDYVVDLNGAAGPNSEPDSDGKYFDIRSFRIAKFSNVSVSCEAKGGFKINGACIVDLGGNYAPLNCTLEKNVSYCAFLNSTEPTVTDYWAGANKACQDLGMKLPDRNTGINLINLSDGVLSGTYFTSDRGSNGDYGGYVHQTSSIHWASRTDHHKAFCLD